MSRARICFLLLKGSSEVRFWNTNVDWTRRQMRLGLCVVPNKIGLYFLCLFYKALCCGNMSYECDDMHGMMLERSDMINA